MLIDNSLVGDTVKLIERHDGTYVWLTRYEEELICRDMYEVFKIGRTLKLERNEIEYGLFEMLNNEHNLAEFGDFNGMFMFTRNLDC